MIRPVTTIETVPIITFLLRGNVNTMSTKDSHTVKSKNTSSSPPRIADSMAVREIVRDTYEQKDIETFLKLLSDVESVEQIRVEKVEKCARLIESGSFETEERIDELADRLLAELL